MSSNDSVTIIRSSDAGDDWQVVCPKCGFEYVHHDAGPVEVWQRSEDTGDPGYAVLSGGRGVKAIARAENPSLRRSGIRLHFWCEGCAGRFALTFAQHKGETLVNWENDSKVPDDVLPRDAEYAGLAGLQDLPGRYGAPDNGSGRRAWLELTQGGEWWTIRCETGTRDDRLEVYKISGVQNVVLYDAPELELDHADAERLSTLIAGHAEPLDVAYKGWRSFHEGRITPEDSEWQTAEDTLNETLPPLKAAIARHFRQKG